LVYLDVSKNPVLEIPFTKNLDNLKRFYIDLKSVKYPPIWYVMQKQKGKNFSDYLKKKELPFVEKIWNLIISEDNRNTSLAKQLAIGQGWTEEEFEMYQSLKD